MFLKIKKNFLELASLFGISIGTYILWKKYVCSDHAIKTKPLDFFKIYYSTETGNSRIISELLGKYLNDVGVNVDINEVNSIFCENNQLFQDNLILIFVLSTCGNGDFPSSSKKFVKFLIKMSKLNKKIFLGVKYTIVGLGSSIYDYTFNSAAVNLDKYISALGGIRYCEIAMLDEVKGNEIELNKWWNNILSKKIGKFNTREFLPPNFTSNQRTKNNYVCVLGARSEIADGNYTFTGECHISGKYFELIKIEFLFKSLLCESLINNEFKKKTFNLKLKVPDRFKYNTFDIIDILPPNPIHIVLFFSSKLFNISDLNDLDNLIVGFNPINSKTTSLKVPFPPLYSLKHILMYFFDLITIPNVEALSQFFPYMDSCEVEHITKCNLINKYRESYKCNFSIFINNFMKSLRPIPIEQFLIFKGMRQRFRSYSISSSSLCSPFTMELTVSTYFEGPIYIEEHSKEFEDFCKKKYFEGLCSNYLFQPNLDSFIYAQIRRPSFKLKNLDSSMLLFSHGSGVAPIRALLHERSYLITNNQFARKKNAYLFYGCRTINEVLYRDELEKLKLSGALTDFYLALSKSRSEHVKEIMLIYKKPIIEVIEDDCSIIYICGKKEFVSGIKRKLASIITENLSNNNIYENMFKKGRVIIETWN